MSSLLVVLLFAIISLVCCGNAISNWEQLGGNPAHTGEWMGAGPRAGCNIQAWTRVPIPSNTNPVFKGLSNNRVGVYFGQWASQVTFFNYAFDVDDEKQEGAALLWNVSHSLIGVVAASTPLLDVKRERVYVITDSLGSGLFCFDATTGKSVWPSFLPTADSTCAPTFGGPEFSLLFVGDWMANFYAVDTETGKVTWQFVDNPPVSPNQMPYNFNCAPVSHPDGSVVYAASLHRLYAFNSLTGSILWNTTTNTIVDMTNPSVQLIFDWANDAILFSGKSNSQAVVKTPLGWRKFWNVAAFSVDASTGAVRWSARPENETVSTIALALSTRLGLFFFGSESSASADPGPYFLQAVFSSNGTELWRISLPSAATSIVVDGMDTVYVTAGSVLAAFDALDGSTLWSWTHNATFANLLAFTPSGSLWVADAKTQFAIGPSSSPCINGQ